MSAAGGLGIVQPLSLVYAHGHKLRDSLRLIRQITYRPIGFNALIEKTTKLEEDNMKRWIGIALEEWVRFFTTALGNPGWVVDKAHEVGGVVYHDVTERKWAPPRSRRVRARSRRPSRSWPTSLRFRMAFICPS